jgi:hypothetical protein
MYAIRPITSPPKPVKKLDSFSNLANPSISLRQKNVKAILLEEPMVLELAQVLLQHDEENGVVFSFEQVLQGLTDLEDEDPLFRVSTNNLHLNRLIIQNYEFIKELSERVKERLGQLIDQKAKNISGNI